MILIIADNMELNTRIVTFMAYPELVKSAKVILLLQGNSTIYLEKKRRYFTARKVAYQEATPIYSYPLSPLSEIRYDTIAELLADNPSLSLFDAPVLDKDNYLRVWEDKI